MNRQQPPAAGLLFHDIVVPEEQSGFCRPAALPYKRSADVFARDLKMLADSGTDVCVPDDLDSDSNDPALFLTFDDGGLSAMHAAEKLGQYGWRGLFFVTTSKIGTSGFLGTQEIVELHRNGHVIGSHSHTHPDIFKELHPQRMTDEWRLSCDILSELLGSPCTLASVPGGDISRIVLRCAANSGIRHLFTSEPWLRPRIVDHCLVIGRVCVRANTPSEKLLKWARFEGWHTALLKRRIKGALKAASGPLYRAYVKAKTRESNSNDMGRSR